MLNEGTAALILNLGARWRGVDNITLRPLYPQEITPIPIQEEAKWEKKPVCTNRREETFLVRAGF